jgi:hypothetical protein
MKLGNEIELRERPGISSLYIFPGIVDNAFHLLPDGIS